MELLPDPCQDRVVSSIKPPPHRPLSKEIMYPYRKNNINQTAPDIDIVKDHLVQEGKLGKDLLI
jgi:serine/threonine-protein phosphatase 2B catalytic subunit